MLQIRVVPTLLDVATLCRNEVTNGIRKAKTFFIWVFFSILCLGRQGKARQASIVVWQQIQSGHDLLSFPQKKGVEKEERFVHRICKKAE